MRVAIACLQETKLNAPDTSKIRSFLPARLGAHCLINSSGTSGGILTAWDPNSFSLVSVSRRAFCLSVTLAQNHDNSCLHVANIYAPAHAHEKASFICELSTLAPPANTPWILLGDFNLTRSPSDKNNSNFSAAEASSFNDALNILGVMEIPLRDRAYTWSNNRENPTLVKLDRVFIDLAWGDLFSNTTLSSLTRFASDHVPLLVNVSTRIPRPSCFRYDRSWSLHEEYRELIRGRWNTTTSHDPAKRITSRLKLCRRLSKDWNCRIGSHAHRERDCKAIIDALDLLEEERVLSPAESHIRALAADSLSLSIKEKVAYWKQRGKIRIAVEGDENTKFFHAHASHRLRKNSIQLLEQDGLEVTDHDEKASILHSYYSDLLGCSSTTTWNFDLGSLYNSSSAWDASSLSRPFEPDEIAAVFRGMNPNSSPGPDGFSPSFFVTFWYVVKNDVLDVFASFFDHSLSLDGLNRAYLVLLPKKDGARYAADFRPISLQSCLLKALAKVLTNRLQPLIPSIVGPDQTGFVKGRCISENFIYAAELLSCCHKRKAPTIVLKLDFHKAFDSIGWDSLDSILAVRGFDSKWRRWITSLLSTGHTSNLLNGSPGRWFQCRRGLRQGDPLSPYLFIIVADVLKQLILRHSADLEHPLVSGVPCPVLQYADDTLILLRGNCSAASVLKRVLEDFAQATGLTINFHKSTFIPLHLTDDESARISDILGCPISSFPQPYLGLPLSPTKLNNADFQPLVANVTNTFLVGVANSYLLETVLF
ncbi:hypothetical protein HU200_049753 [Digitaria exilis]|uniref:Reverse transcriptase domain-containing protein n=1 Tax=Digitaria exilis TaxID=1010633 RepID=A0A835E9M6_9POAL|nr:hypothetical protein HU200_049753 [Digitaria exilis]